jgi:hypothetical protein
MIYPAYPIVKPDKDSPANFVWLGRKIVPLPAAGIAAATFVILTDWFEHYVFMLNIRHGYTTTGHHPVSTPNPSKVCVTELGVYKSISCLELPTFCFF